MLYTTVQNVPRYSPAMSTLSNGVDVLKALSENHWDATAIPIAPGVVALVNPDSDGTLKTGAINYYDVTVGLRTTRCKYLRQAMKVLDDAIAAKGPAAADKGPARTADADDPECRRAVRKGVLDALRAGGWSVINTTLPCGMPVTVTPIHSNKNGRQAIRGYALKGAIHEMYADSLNVLAAKMLSCKAGVAVTEADRLAYC